MNNDNPNQSPQPTDSNSDSGPALTDLVDALQREIFLNLTVDEAKVLSYQLKPPFDALLKHRFQSLSRGGETSLELLNYITKNIEIVDLFNSEMGSYYRGEKQFPAQNYQVML